MCRMFLSQLAQCELESVLRMLKKSVEAASSQDLLDETIRDKQASGSNAHAAGPHLLSALILYARACVCVCVCACVI